MGRIFAYRIGRSKWVEYREALEPPSKIVDEEVYKGHHFSQTRWKGGRVIGCTSYNKLVNWFNTNRTDIIPVIADSQLLEITGKLYENFQDSNWKEQNLL